MTETTQNDPLIDFMSKACTDLQDNMLYYQTFTLSQEPTALAWRTHPDNNQFAINMPMLQRLLIHSAIDMKKTFAPISSNSFVEETLIPHVNKLITKDNRKNPEINQRLVELAKKVMNQQKQTKQMMESNGQQWHDDYSYQHSEDYAEPLANENDSPQVRSGYKIGATNEETQIEWRSIGIPLFNYKVGTFMPQLNWIGRMRLKPDINGRKLLINLFHFQPSIPEKSHLEHWIQDSNHFFSFFRNELERFKCSRIMKIGIPFDNIIGISLVEQEIRGKSVGLLTIDVNQVPVFSTRRVSVEEKGRSQSRERSDWTNQQQASNSGRHYFVADPEELKRCIALIITADERLNQIYHQQQISNISIETSPKLTPNSQSQNQSNEKKSPVTPLNIANNSNQNQFNMGETYPDETVNGNDSETDEPIWDGKTRVLMYDSQGKIDPKKQIDSQELLFDDEVPDRVEEEPEEFYQLQEISENINDDNSEGKKNINQLILENIEEEENEEEGEDKNNNEKINKELGLNLDENDENDDDNPLLQMLKDHIKNKMKDGFEDMDFSSKENFEYEEEQEKEEELDDDDDNDNIPDDWDDIDRQNVQVGKDMLANMLMNAVTNGQGINMDIDEDKDEEEDEEREEKNDKNQ